MKISPTSKRILVRKTSDDHTTVGNFVLKENEANKPVRGVVVAIGKNLEEDIPLSSTVVFSQFNGVTIEEDNKDTYIVVKASDILAVIKE